MANPIRIRRRNSGAAGAPTTLVNAELAFNEMDSTLYYGNGTDANGAATSILAIAGSGAFTTLTSAQTISGNKTFSGNLIAVTQNSTDSSTKVATTAFVANKLVNLANVVNSFNTRTGNVSLTFADVDAVAGSSYVPFDDTNSIQIESNDSTNFSRLNLGSGGTACLTGNFDGLKAISLELVSHSSNATARLTGVGAWEANSILIRSYADARYLPVNGTGTIANLTVTGNLTAVTQANGVSSTLVATTAYVSNRITEIQTTANGAYVPISSSTTSTVTSTDGFSVSRLTLNGTTPAACLTSTNNSGTALSLLLDPPTGQVTLTGMTSWAANSVLTRSYADSRYIQSTSNGSVSDLTVGGDLVVTGNVTVNGNTTTLNSVTLTIDDKNIELGSVASPSNTTADGGGLTLKGATDKSLIWYNATNAWTSSENLTLVTGKTYQINGVNVLTSTALGSTVVSSSLTSVGTISTGVWQGSAVGVAYGGTGAATLTGYVKGSGTAALTASSTIPGADISGNITGNAAGLTGTLTVGFGGTGVTTLTSGSYLKGNGTGAITTSSTIPVGDLSGTLSVAGGGTGAVTLTGYVKGSGTSALTASSTIPGSDISGNITGNATNVTGIVAVVNGGTGAANATAARTNLLAAASGSNTDITSLGGLTTALSVSQGGTGVNTLLLNGYIRGNGTSGVTACTTIPGTAISGNITGNAAGLTGTLTVAFGGTGVATLTSGSYLKGNGTGAVTASASIPVADLFGTIGVAGGGTGATTLTGYVKGAGTSALTAASTIPGADISGNITGNAAGLTGTLAVGFGGTGATTLTSGAYLKGNGTGAITSASSTVPVTDVSGILTVAQGGTGVNTLLLNGYIRGNGTSGVTASTTIPGSAISGDITANATNVTGIVAVANGGTGSANITTARTNLLAATRGANTDITSLAGLTTALSVAQGGTGATTLTGIIKGNGVGAFTAATEGTDFLSASSTIDGGTF